jgi:hypothetical protein
MRNAYKISVRKSEGSGKYRHRRENIIEMVLKETGCKSLWI